MLDGLLTLSQVGRDPEIRGGHQAHELQVIHDAGQCSLLPLEGGVDQFRSIPAEFHVEGAFQVIRHERRFPGSEDVLDKPGLGFLLFGLRHAPLPVQDHEIHGPVFPYRLADGELGWKGDLLLQLLQRLVQPFFFHGTSDPHLEDGTGGIVQVNRFR